MSYPEVSRLELPILQELAATGGTDDVRFLYARLLDYFPQFTESERESALNGQARSWRRLVQRAGRQLDEAKCLTRKRGLWTITARGRHRAHEEATRFELTETRAGTAREAKLLTHEQMQQMLVEIGSALGFYAQTEFEAYDVVWREAATSVRLSHVFEVQRRGNLDSALAKLKRAYDAQRSKPFLILTNERDARRAERELSQARAGAFHEIGRAATLLTAEQLKRLHRALLSVEEILTKIIE